MDIHLTMQATASGQYIPWSHVDGWSVVEALLKMIPHPDRPATFNRHWLRGTFELWVGQSTDVHSNSLWASCGDSWVRADPNATGWHITGWIESGNPRRSYSINEDVGDDFSRTYEFEEQVSDGQIVYADADSSYFTNVSGDVTGSYPQFSDTYQRVLVDWDLVSSP